MNTEPDASDTERELLVKILTVLNLGGGGSALTKESLTSPASPFSRTVTRRSVVEVNYTVESTGDAARIMVARTGVATFTMENSGGNTQRGSGSFQLGPGDSITVTASTAGAAASVSIDAIVVYTF